MRPPPLASVNIVLPPFVISAERRKVDYPAGRTDGRDRIAADALTTSGFHGQHASARRTDGSRIQDAGRRSAGGGRCYSGLMGFVRENDARWR